MALILDPNQADDAQSGSTQPGGTQPGGTGATPGDVIKDTDTANFMADVIEMSKQIPVIVDFWAPWCEPCKQLGPALEKFVANAGGLVRLVKINIDENKDLAGQMRVQSIPAVYAFKNGQPVDGFTGVVPESQLRSFVEKLIGDAQSPIDAALDQAQQLAESGQTDQARSLYEQIIGQDSENPKALAGLIRIIIEAGEREEANEIINALTPALKQNPDIAGVISMLELAEQSSEAGDVQDLRNKLSANDKDHQVRFDLAMALYSNGDNENAVQELLELIRHDQKWNDEAARIQLLKILEVLGFNHPISSTARRQLSAILFT